MSSLLLCDGVNQLAIYLSTTWRRDTQSCVLLLMHAFAQPHQLKSSSYCVAIEVSLNSNGLRRLSRKKLSDFVRLSEYAVCGQESYVIKFFRGSSKSDHLQKNFTKGKCAF